MTNSSKIIQMNIEDIIPYENNPRINDEAVEKVKNSIKEFGFNSPIILDGENVIICGHTRLKAAKELKLKKVPCVVKDDLTPEQVKAYRLADNKVGELANWNYELLDAELAELVDFDMKDFGFLDFNFEPEDDMFETVEPKEKEPEYITCPHCGEKFEKP